MTTTLRLVRSLLLAVVATLAFANVASAATVPVNKLAAPFEASNSTIHSTAEGVHFGTYADGGAIGGTLTYNGLNGQPLSALTDFSYTFTYRQSDNTTGAAPYARVFLDDTGDGVADHDVILDPSFCATTTPAEATDLTFQMIGNSVRFDDDSCDGVAPDNQPYATAIAGHQDDVIVGLKVSQGFSTGHDVSALLRNITVNGTTFDFAVPPANGAQGPVGQSGTTTNTVVTRVVQVPQPQTCTGNTVRTIRAPRRSGERFLDARATLLRIGKDLRLGVQGRVITLDLSSKPEANYNVRIRARYRTASGKVRVVKTNRNLSVVCS